ncbi:hypothetical protein J1614_005550 [Plenodomus biglobosus]|nr:hypothetical protein J1614_005550 [Plenodomus biglobosus]
MLSSMTAHGYEKTDLTRDDLTDEVIETLYDIVRRAQSSTDKSSRALFAAYGAVLEEQGLQPSDDAVLHRFLFHMQKHRRPGEDLVQRFGRVLKESFDIDVEINEDGEGIEVTTNLEATRNGAQASLGRYSRRGSFESFFDGTADKVAGTDYGDLSLRTRPGSHGALNGYGGEPEPRRTRSDSEARAYGRSLLPVRNKVDGNPRRSVSGPHQSHRKRSASMSSRGSLQIRRNQPVLQSRNGGNDGSSDFTDRTTSLDLSHVQIPGVNAPIPDDRDDSRDHHKYMPEPYRPSDTRLLDEAETFEEQRLHRVTRQCIQAWRRRTQERISAHESMDIWALAFRRHILLKVSFPLICKAATIRRNNRETDRFFTRLESRADKARALFLLTKAFTHWAKSAEDEVQRTSVARRHILRTRFFNGWRDITAVNELKTQHFVLGNFLRRWRAKAEEAREIEAYAVAHYEQNLVRRVFRELRDKYFNAAAPRWHNDHVKMLTLRKMVEIAKVLREHGTWATDRYERSVLRKGFEEWQQRTVFVRSQHVQADEHQRRTQLSSAFQTLHKQSQLGPLLRQFQARINDRVLRNAFQTWHKDARLSRQARNVDQLRVLRNAYTAWNDRLRSKVVEDRINDRVIVKSLYKWTLASRVSLFQRVHDRHLKESTFLAWVTKANQRANTLDAAEQRFAQFKRAQLLRTCLRKMEIITSEKRREEFAILAEYQQKLKQRIFDKLKERNAHFQQLNQWTKDARFYVLSKRTLKTWGEATQHARRNRRRETYAQIRRTLKMNLVKKVFEHWRERSAHISALDQQAMNLSENRVLQSASAKLHQWHDRAILLRQMDGQATGLYSHKLGGRYLDTWTSRLGVLQRLDRQAVALRQESTELAAASALKKLGWRLWNLQRKEENAKALYGRNFEKHVRAMIRYWFEQVVERRAERGRDTSPSPTSRSRRDGNDGQGGQWRDDDDDNHDNDNDGQADTTEPQLGPTVDETLPLEPWTAFDETALDINTTNALDLSFNITPERRQRESNLDLYAPPTSASRQPSIQRPNTYPQPHSILRPPPLHPTIPETDEHDLEAEAEETFWSSTPLPPPPSATATHRNQHSTTRPSHASTTASLHASKPQGKPGYLKTPSKRTLVRAKRPELGASPQKNRLGSPVRRALGLEGDGHRGLGVMSAPPGRVGWDAGRAGGASGGVTSFQQRLREGGFGGTVGVGAGAGAGGIAASAMRGTRFRESGRAKGKAKVGFEATRFG